jgi:ADP-ribose pyrophosphatase
MTGRNDFGIIDLNFVGLGVRAGGPCRREKQDKRNEQSTLHRWRPLKRPFICLTFARLYTSFMPARTPRAIPAHPDAVIVSQQRAWSGRFAVDLIQFRHRCFDGEMSEPRTWELWRRGRAVALVPYDPVHDSVVLIEQFRLPALAAGIEPVMVELPAGLIEDGEQPEAAMHRELREEMRMTADRLERIGAYLLSSGSSDELLDLYVGRVHAPGADADGIVGVAGLKAEGEDIRTRVWSAEKAIARALEGGMPNSVTTIGLLWLAAKRDELRRKWSKP